MLSINTNLSSIIVQNSMKQSTNALNQAIERMTTGFKINHAKDNAANYSISTNMTTKIGSYQIAEENAAMGLDLVTTASSTLDLVSEHVQRIRDLCEQASNGTYGAESLKAIQSEVDARQQEIDRILSQAEFNGIKMLEGGESSGGVTGKFLAPVTQLTEEQAIAQGYTIIKTADELQAMQDDLNGKYILMNDIDLSGYDWVPIGQGNYFRGELNGNGYVIRNLTLNDPAEDHQALIGQIMAAKINNLGLENVNVTGNYGAAGLYTGGPSAIVTNCYVTGTVNGNECVGGIYGDIEGNKLSDSYSMVKVTGSSRVGVVGGCTNGSLTTSNVYYANDLSAYSGIGDGTYGEIGVTTAELNALIVPPTAVSGDKTVTLQVGTKSDSNSQISFVSSVALESLTINCLDSDSARNSLQILDDYLGEISAKQVEYGAVQNRLESALDEISTQYENLVSSRSTIRDTDIADVSSKYIQQQILQQAAATLMATANQSPAIALQLI